MNMDIKFLLSLMDVMSCKCKSKEKSERDCKGKEIVEEELLLGRRD